MRVFVSGACGSVRGSGKKGEVCSRAQRRRAPQRMRRAQCAGAFEAYARR